MSTTILPIVGPIVHTFRGTILLAGQFADTTRKLRRNNEKFEWEELLYLLSVILVVLLVCIVSSRIHERWKRAQVRSPKALFRELCKAHRLDRKSVRLLKELANCRQLRHHSLLFVEQQHFEPMGLTASLSNRLEDLDRLRQQLFSTAER